MSTVKHQRLVLALLVALTLVSLGFTADGVVALLSERGAAALAALLAFIKARLVALDFMELRGAPAMRLFDLWLSVVGALAILLILR